jgi:hypothetical protein
LHDALVVVETMEATSISPQRTFPGDRQGRKQCVQARNVYMEILEPEMRSTVDSIHRELSRKTVPATSPEPAVAAFQSPDGRKMEEAPAAPAALSINTADEVAGRTCEADWWSGFGICDKDAPKSRKGGAKCLK